MEQPLNTPIKGETQTTDDKIDWGRVQAWIQTGIMFLLGLYFIDLALPGGNLGNYINVDNFAWLTWLGAAILIGIAFINTLDLLRGQHVANPHQRIDPNYGVGRPGSRASWIFLAIVAIPLILGLGVSSEPLGAAAINKTISADVRSIGVGSATIAIPPAERNILDWIRAFAGTADLREFNGQEVDAIGFVYQDARFHGTDRFMLVRFTLSCCVADARPIGLIVQDDLGLELAQDTWVRVRGKLDVQLFDGIETPIIIAESIEVTDQPEHPYLYY